jgi:diguanylate cyclase (GGDEF)-like protein
MKWRSVVVAISALIAEGLYLTVMGMEQNAIRVLVTMAEYVKEPDDPNQGRHSFPAKELSELIGLRPGDISDAVDLLERRGHAKALRALGTHPYSFIQVGLTPQGRLEAEKHSGEPQAHEIDALLQIRNRGAFDLDLRLILGKRQQAKTPIALLMIDLDHFKTFNDNHGHLEGDKVLKATAATLRNVVGTKGNCYRYGGEELVALLPNYSSAEVLPLAERIRTSIASIRLDGLPQITVSVGVSLSDSSGYDAAKNAGRNVVKIDSPPSDATASD